MITINNKEYRNLQEQVLKNKEDIARHYDVDRVLADWGIKVLGVVSSIDSIPEAEYNYGDAFGLSTTDPMQYVVWTRANNNVGEPNDYWLNIGAISLVGPQGPTGPQGIQGPQGVRGSKWTTATSNPSITSGYNMGDQWLNTTTGAVFEFRGNVWANLGNIKGSQGPTGPTGPRGSIGPQGPTGPQGPKGDTGSSFIIGGLLENSDNLPIPTEENRHIGYAVKNIDGVTYDLYIVVGTDNLLWVNMGRVEGVEGPQGPTGPQGPAGIGATIIPISSSSKGGTLNPTQLQTIKTATYPIINLNNEYFVKADIYDSQNEFVFSHVGQKNGGIYTKTLRLNTQSGDWTLKEMIVEQVLDMNDFETGEHTFTIPEEYRPFDIISRCVLLYNNKLHFFAGEYSGDLEDYELSFRSISQIHLSNTTLYASYSYFDVYPGSAEQYNFQTLLNLNTVLEPYATKQYVLDQISASITSALEEDY